jgi:hypothetical protein
MRAIGQLTRITTNESYDATFLIFNHARSTWCGNTMKGTMRLITSASTEIRSSLVEPVTSPGGLYILGT